MEFGRSIGVVLRGSKVADLQRLDALRSDLIGTSPLQLLSGLIDHEPLGCAGVDLARPGVLSQEGFHAWEVPGGVFLWGAIRSAQAEQRGEGLARLRPATAG